MIRAFFGFTFLLAALIPIGGQLVQMVVGLLYRGNLRGWASTTIYFLSLVAVYIPPAIATFWFFRAARIHERVPTPRPGRQS